MTSRSAANGARSSTGRASVFRETWAQTARKIDRVEFVGYGLDVPALSQDYRGKDVNGAAVVWLGAAGPANADQSRLRLLNNRRSVCHR